jgi:hypothetical protein
MFPNYLEMHRQLLENEKNKGIQARINFKAKKTKPKRKKKR